MALTPPIKTQKADSDSFKKWIYDLYVAVKNNIANTTTNTTAISGISPGAGVSQTWTSVLASRALATVYQNTGSAPIQVAITASHASNSAVTAARCDTASTPTTIVGQGGGISGAYAVYNFIVPVNSYYQIAAISDSGNCSIAAWAELS